MRPDILKRREKYKEKTQAERIFKNAMLLNERPDNMSYDQYRSARQLQTKAMRILFPKQNNPHLSRVMAPRQKSKHMLEMWRNAYFIKHGHYKDITEEVGENRFLQGLEQNWVTKQFNKIREIFKSK